jgi:UDP-N-acetylmuramyl pentapeptide phosphotransferase/UDP-N-acetylglucosamine-1-phosphate transferase
MPHLWMFAGSAALGLGLGLVGAAVMIRRAGQGGTPIDVPDPRRLHTRPTPRGGGIGLLLAGIAGTLLGALAAQEAADRRMVLVVGLAWALPNGVMGWVDDHLPMRSRVKFTLQVLFAVAAAGLGLRLEGLHVPPLPSLDLGALSWVFYVLWLVWVGNLYNFMDGMDALAGGAGLIFFAGFAVWAVWAGAYGLACFALALSGGSLGFLRYNAPPARIFMGDGGSLYVGAALGGLAVALGRSDVAAVPLAASALLLGLFVWDTTFTIAKRALRREPMLPHRTHLYQRLALAGWTHGRVRAFYLGTTFLFALAAVASPRLAPVLQGALLALALAACIGLVLFTQHLERARR